MAPSRKPSEKQVAAWLYDVIAPLLNGLTEEDYFVRRQGTPTWRWASGKCRFVRPTASHVDPSQLPNLAQFLTFHPKLAKRAFTHDAALETVEVSATRTFEALMALDTLRTLADKIEHEFPGWQGAGRPEDRAKHLAENIINFEPSTDLGDRTDAPAWKKYGPDAVAFRRDPSVAPHDERLRAGITGLGIEIETLQTALSKVRDKLADEHGLPRAAPITTTGYVEREFF